MIAGGAWLAGAGGPKGLKAFGTGPSAEISGCAHETGDGTNDLSSAAAVGGRLRRNVRCTMPLYKKLATIIFNGCSGYLLSVVAEINIYILHPQVNKIFGRFTLAGGVI